MISLKIAEFFNSLIACTIAYGIITMFSGYFQAWVAKKLGDTTAQDADFMSLNPIVYIDVVGFLFFLLTGFGWGKQVPINPANFTGKYRRFEELITYGSQTFANGILSLITLLILVVCFGGISAMLPIPSFFADHIAITKAFRLIIITMARFSIFFTFYSLLLALMRLTVLYFGHALEWHEVELISIGLAILMLYLFEGPITYFISYIIINLEFFIWHWWSSFATLLGFISLYR